jgi:hypothetical protein
MTGANFLFKHPVFSSATVLATSPINEIYCVVRRVILLRDTACVFSARSGTGKTRALIRIGELLRGEFPELVIVDHSNLNKPMASVRGFFKHFLTSAGHAELNGETYDLRLRLTNRLLDMAAARNSEIVVFLIDEANAMCLDDFLFLKDVYNALDNERIQLITIMMGQEPQLGEALAKFREKDRADLQNRFAKRILPFRQFNQFGDMEMVLKQYDINVMADEKGHTWTQSLLPCAWENGFRLGNEAQPFLDAYSRQGGETFSTHGMSARIVFLTIRSFFLNAADLDGPGVRLAPSAWDEALLEATIENATIEAKAERALARKRKI